MIKRYARPTMREREADAGHRRRASVLPAHLGTDSGPPGHRFRPTWAPIPEHLGGVETPVAVVNHLFRGVPLGSGEHVVELRFAPRSYALGWRLSAAVRLLLLLAAWELRR